jgi:hypothetical protein
MGYASYFVMAGLVPAIHVLRSEKKDVDARHKAGHDGCAGWRDITIPPCAAA